jgi:hypothetical protein
MRDVSGAFVLARAASESLSGSGFVEAGVTG